MIFFAVNLSFSITFNQIILNNNIDREFRLTLHWPKMTNRKFFFEQYLIFNYLSNFSTKIRDILA